MRRWVPVATGLAALVLLGTVDASAQTPAAMQANIPFEFKVGSLVFPAGLYDVTYDGEAIPSALVVRSRDGHHEALVLTETVDTKATKNARLVFEKEGGAYVLHEVVAPDARTGLELLEKHSKA